MDSSIGQCTPFGMKQNEPSVNTAELSVAKKLSRYGHDRAEVPAYEIGMVLHGLGERAEDDARLGQLLLEGRGHRHRVDDRVDRHAAEALLLGEGDPELVEHGPQFGVDLVEARQRGLRLRGRVVADVLVVDRPVVDVLPVRLGESEPVAVGAQAPFEQPLRLVLLGRDQSG